MDKRDIMTIIVFVSVVLSIYVSTLQIKSLKKDNKS